MQEQTNDDWDIKEVYDSPLRPIESMNTLINVNNVAYTKMVLDKVGEQNNSKQ